MRYSGKYIKPQFSLSSPGHIMSVVCETDRIGASLSGDYSIDSLKRVHTAQSHRRRNEWTETIVRTFDNGQSFHDYLESCSLDRKCLNVVSPIASHSLLLTGFFDRITSAGSIYTRGEYCKNKTKIVAEDKNRYKFSALVLSGTPDIVRYRRDKGTIQWVSGKQFFQSSDREIEECVLSALPREGVDSDGIPADTIPANRLVLVWLELWKKLSDWWLNVNGGQFGQTPGQMSMSFFKRRLIPKAISTHSNKDVAKLENNAIFGGRSSTWFYGQIISHEDIPNGPIKRKQWFAEDTIHDRMSHLDIRSMYPYIMSRENFPIKLVSSLINPRVEQIRELAVNHCVIASAKLYTQVGEFPYRSNDKIIYPVGRFNTVLCGDELCHAIDNGSVESIHSAAVYDRGKPFRRMAEDLLRLRKEYRENGGRAFEMFVKCLSNSFGGKLAQRQYKWINRPKETAKMEWGEWYDRCHETGIYRRYRAIAGMVTECLKDSGETRLLGSCFAYLTMYGRQMMRRIRETVPSMSVISQDTDGLWVLPKAMEMIPKDKINKDYEPGSLAHKCDSSFGKFYSPKHYWSDYGWILSGFHSPIVLDNKLELWHDTIHTPICGSIGVPDSVVMIKHNKDYLKPIKVDGVIQPNGWTLPLQLGLRNFV